MKILYLSYDGMTDQLGQSQVLPYLTGLSAAGHQIHLVSFEKPGRFEKFRTTIEPIVNTAGITWHPLTYHKTPPVLSTLRDLNRLKKFTRQLHDIHQFDIVHCRSYITAFAGLDLKKKTGIRFIFDMRGFYADERVDGKIWKLNNPLYNFIYHYFKRKEKEFLINADHTVSLTHAAAEIIQHMKLKGNNALPVTVIPCCADLQLFNYENYNASIKQEVRAKLKIADDAFVLVYLGAIGTWYMLDEMLDFFNNLVKNNTKAVFLFITHEPAAFIINKAREHNINKDALRIIGASRNEVPYYLAAANLSVFFIVPTFSKKASSPTKQGELMGMGIPIICNAGVGDTDEIINKSQCGFVLSSLDEAGFNAAAMQADRLTEISKEKIREGAKAFYSLEKGVAAYDKIYQSLKF